MKKLLMGFAAGSILFAGSFAVLAAETPTTEPTKHAPTSSASVKVEAPYSKLTDLTDVERSKLAEIHKKALADLKAVKEKEDEDSRAVLTDDQKAELDKVAAEKKETMSEKNKARRMKGATTAPAAD